MPHLPGCDFTVSPQAGFLVVAVCACFRVQARRAFVREQDGAGWPPHPATQADADVTTTRISSVEVISDLFRTGPSCCLDKFTGKSVGLVANRKDTC
jgi:hypothetical protein